MGINFRPALKLSVEYGVRECGLIVALRIAVLGIALLPSTVRADKWPNCTYDTRSAEYALCAIQELNRELAELRKQMDIRYRDVVAKIPDKSVDVRRHLEQAQTAWQRYVDESCAFEGAVVGGADDTIRIAILECLSRQTRARLSVLTQWSTMN